MKVQAFAVSPSPRLDYHEHEAMMAVIDGTDQVAHEMETKWGVGRLELLVTDELREKFRRQQRLFNDAIDARDVATIQRTGAAMRRGWVALDGAATAAGASLIDPEVWEVRLADGRIAAFCRTKIEAAIVTRQGRYLEVWTAEEIARIISEFPSIVAAKRSFPGATVVDIRPKRVSQPDWGVGDAIPF